MMEKYYADAVEKAKKREAFENEIKHQLRTEDRFIQYFSTYSEESVEQFINHYAKQKAGWHENVNSYWHLSKNKESKWYTLAKEAINKIAEKKVYNQMCRWLMREVTFPGMEISKDWDMWLTNPLFCPFAEPIEKEEVDAHINFMRSLDPSTKYDEFFSSTSFTPMSHVDELKDIANGTVDPEEDEDEKYYNYSRWFRYYDEVFSTQFVGYVPVGKLKKESYFVHYKHNLEKDPNVVNYWEVEGYTYPKHLSLEEQIELMDRYVKQYETYENKLRYEGWRWNRITSEFSEKVESIIHELQEYEEYVAIESNDDWREGLVQANEMFEREKILDALPHAYEEYVYLLSHKLGFEDWIEQKESYVTAEFLVGYKASILEGMRLNNEPENFDFW
jgi:hypothetical protein